MLIWDVNLDCFYLLLIFLIYGVAHWFWGKKKIQIVVYCF